MVLRLGDIELEGLQRVSADEQRTLVEQRVPGQSANRFQDLGREPITLYLEGWLLGEVATEQVETLRQAQHDAAPVTFASDIAVGSDLVDVLIREVQVDQPAGYRHRFWFAITVQEYQEPPEPPGAGLGGLLAGVDIDAGSWLDGAMGVMEALRDPSLLPELLADLPGLLEDLDLDDLAGSIVGALEDLTGTDLGAIMDALAEVDLDAALELVEKLKDADSLGDVLGILAEDGLGLLEDLTGVDLGAAGALIAAAKDGGAFLKDLQSLVDSAEHVVALIGDFDLPAFISQGDAYSGTVPKDLVAAIGAVVTAARGLVEHDLVDHLGDLVAELGIGPQLASGTELVAGGIDEFAGVLDSVDEPLRHLGALGGLLHIIEPLVTALGDFAAHADDVLAPVGLDQAIGLEQIQPLSDQLGAGIGDAAAVLAGLPSVADVDALQAEIGGLADAIRGLATGAGA